MKKLSVLSLIVMLFTINAFSQDKGYVAVSLGAGIPTGDFASKDMNNRSSGFAKAGAIFDISFAYKLDKKFGIIAMLRGQAHKTDAQAMAEEMIKQMPFDNISISTQSESWSIGAILVGGYGSFPIEKQLSFESRLMIGFLSATAPKATFNLSTPEGTAWVKQSSATGSAFAYQIGAGLKYNAGKRVCMLVNIDYMGATPKFKDVEVTSSIGYDEKNDYFQSLGSFNLGVGVGYRL
ncbi:MAG: hypothetical protein ACK55K_07700 [Bacteroidota bacterium]